MDNVIRTLNETAAAASSAVSDEESDDDESGGGLGIDLSLTRSVTALRPSLRTEEERARYAADGDDTSDSLSLAIPVL